MQLKDIERAHRKRIEVIAIVTLSYYPQALSLYKTNLQRDVFQHSFLDEHAFSYMV
jgi:hypothetical protein